MRAQGAAGNVTSVPAPAPPATSSSAQTARPLMDWLRSNAVLFTMLSSFIGFSAYNHTTTVARHQHEMEGQKMELDATRRKLAETEQKLDALSRQRDEELLLLLNGAENREFDRAYHEYLQARIKERNAKGGAGKQQ